jgi:polyketide synthase 7
VAQGLALFDAALTVAEPAVTATPFDLAAVRVADRTPPLFRALVAASDGGAARPTADGGVPLAERLAELTGAARREFLLEVVRGEVAVVLGFRDPAVIDPQRPFQEMGFDSLTAVELRNRLGAVSGVRLPATVVFDHPTPADLTDFLCTGLVPENSAPQSPVLAELDRLEEVLAAASDTDHSTVTVRLQTILSRWLETWGATGDVDRSDPIDSASTDELLDFIDNELGRAAH